MLKNLIVQKITQGKDMVLKKLEALLCNELSSRYDKTRRRIE